MTSPRVYFTKNIDEKSAFTKPTFGERGYGRQNKAS